MSRGQPRMWLPEPGSLTAAHTPTESTYGQMGWTPPYRQGEAPPGGNEVTRWAHDLERSWWRHLAELEEAVLPWDEEAQIHPEYADSGNWEATFGHFAEPPGVMQGGARLSEAVRQACHYVAGLMHRFVGHVDLISETHRETIVRAMAEVRVNAHASANFRSQAAGLYGNTSGYMDYGHAQAHAAYTEGVSILNHAYETLRYSGESRLLWPSHSTFPTTVHTPADPTGHFQSLGPVLEQADYGHGNVHIGAGYSGHHFNLPPDHYQSLGHHKPSRQSKASVYFPTARPRVSL